MSNSPARTTTPEATTSSIGFASMRTESQKLYGKGDVHAVFADITPGTTTVCLVTTSETKCVDADVPASGVLPIVIR